MIRLGHRGADQIATIQQWVAEGAVEGDPTDLPPTPRFPERWQLSQPDLVVTLPQVFTLLGESKDVYRNFVVAIPVHSRAELAVRQGRGIPARQCQSAASRIH